MKRILQLFAIVALIFSFACHRSTQEYQAVADHFVVAYYLHINSKEALEFSRGPAAEKLQREVDLLQGVEPAGKMEQPKMEYKVLPCKKLDADSVECDYELRIEDVKTRIRHGKLTLKRMQEHWWVSDYVEAEYNDPS